jgi:phage terminase large subunit GpA-like protein
MKSAQTGFTTMIIAAIGHSIDRDPCRMMVIQLTDPALSDFNREKLQPAIEGSVPLREKVVPQTWRSAVGSTI